MEGFDRKKHWDNIYSTKELTEVSWYQATPESSLEFIRKFNLSKSAAIIDIGGGDSLLVDHLLDQDYQNITVLDISEAAIERSKERLGKRAEKVKWVVEDAVMFHPEEKYEFWHDRAAFHFLTDDQEIARYIETAQKSIVPNGILVIGTFSEDGPRKCSGIEIKQYSEHSMTKRLKPYFDKIKCTRVDHKTPSGSIQNFVFCSFRRPKTDDKPL